MPTRRHPRAPSAHTDTRHEKIIRSLIAADPRMCRNGFWQSVRNVAKSEGLDVDELNTSAFRPDAYLIDHERQRIDIVEVEVTCPLSARKLDDYAWFWFLWECEATDWEPRLFVVDRYGNGNELPLQRLYYDKVEQEARPKEAA